VNEPFLPLLGFDHYRCSARRGLAVARANRVRASVRSPVPRVGDSGGILRGGHFARWGRRACRRTRPLLFPSRVRLRKLEGLAEYAFRHHHAQIYRYLRRKTGDHDQAEELTQEVFADAAITLSRMDCRPASVLALLYTIAQRRFADEVRRPAIHMSGRRLTVSSKRSLPPSTAPMLPARFAKRCLGFRRPRDGSSA
jgi:Sigma-70 region 2